MYWYIKRFRKADGELYRFLRKFEVFAESVTGASAFALSDAAGLTAIYLPPIASKFAKSAGAVECVKPRHRRLVLVGGQPDTWDFYFGTPPEGRLHRRTASRTVSSDLALR